MGPYDFSQPAPFPGMPIPPSQMFDLGGFPGMSGMTGNIAAMLMQGMLPQMMGPNLFPGQFAPTQNLYDHKMALQHFMNRRAAMSHAAQSDSDTYFRMMRGMATAGGIEWSEGGEQWKAAQRFSGLMSQFTPLIADMAPDLFDRIHGIRGSAQIGAGRIFEGGRYSLDPTGAGIGLGAGAGVVSKEIFRKLYGAGADISEMRGLGMGRAGSMYDEMTRRGYLPTLSREEGLAGVSDKVSKAFGMDAGKDLFKDMNNPQLDNALRSLQGSRAADTIKNMAGAVSAMRDIFGDMGRPNAPMLELINGINALTHGGMSHMKGPELENSVRSIYNTAKMTGIGMEGVMSLMGQSSQLASRMGLNSVFGPAIGMSSAQAAFAFGTIAQPVGFGAMDKEKFAMYDVQMRTQAAGSEAARRLGLIMNLSDAGLLGAGKAADIAMMIKKGTMPAGMGGMTDAQLKAMLLEGGISNAQASGYMAQQVGTYEAQISKYNLQNVVVGLQAGERTTMMTNLLSGGLSMYGADKGVSGATLAAAAQEALVYVSGKNPDVMGDANQRNAAIAARMKTQLGTKANGMTDKELYATANAAFTNMAGVLRQSGSMFGGVESPLMYAQMQNPETIKRTLAAAQSIAAASRMQTALSGVGQSDFTQRISDVMQGLGAAGKGASLKDAIMEMLGGVSSDRLGATMTKTIDELDKLNADLPGATPAQSKDIVKRMRELGPLFEKEYGLLRKSLLVAPGGARDSATRGVGVFEGKGIGDDYKLGDVGEGKDTGFSKAGVNRGEAKGDGGITKGSGRTASIDASKVEVRTAKVEIVKDKDSGATGDKPMIVKGTINITGMGVGEAELVISPTNDSRAVV